MVKSNSQFTLGDFKGYLLDEFIRRCAGFESIELRSRHWIRVIRERLETHAGPIRILFLGSDTSLNMIAEAFSVSEIERLEFDVFCPDSECTDALKKGIVGGSCGANELMRVQFIRESVHRLLQLHFAGDTGAFATYDLILSTSFIESLANKNAVYLIAFALRLLRERGNLMLFSGQEDYSPLREHWLLWFNHCLETKDWRSYLSFGVNWKQTDFEYGKLTVFESTSEN